jgi:hypothetical protein
MKMWLPIETAPKDGTSMLLWIEGRYHIGGWSRTGDISYPFAWVNEYGDIIARPWQGDPEPTHWMPLPDPPTATIPVYKATSDDEGR